MLVELPWILLVEDDENEKLLSQRALSKAGFNSVVHVPDGLQAKAYLEAKAAGSSDAPMPDIVLMDLNLPGMDGHQVLEWMVGRPELRMLQRYVLSSSVDPLDRERAARTGIADYFVKPLRPDDIAKLKHAYEQLRFGPITAT